MICPDCQEAEDQCMRCDGIGSLCDQCGEAAEDEGLDHCSLCKPQ